MTPRLHLAAEQTADRLLSEDPNALLVGMVLDQQVPLEKAFRGPAVIAERMGGAFDIAAIAATGEDEFVALCSAKPAIHRFPGSMAKRVRQVAQALVADYDGQAANLWAGVDSGAELRRRLQALPGFGPDKAAIFLALLGKQLDVTPPGWREAAGAFGRPDTYLSVADITDEDSLARVRESKRAAKAERKAAAATSGSADS